MCCSCPCFFLVVLRCSASVKYVGVPPWCMCLCIYSWRVYFYGTMLTTMLNYFVFSALAGERSCVVFYKYYVVGSWGQWVNRHVEAKLLLVECTEMLRSCVHVSLISPASFGKAVVIHRAVKYCEAVGVQYNAKMCAYSRSRSLSSFVGGRAHLLLALVISP